MSDLCHAERSAAQSNDLSLHSDVILENSKLSEKR